MFTICTPIDDVGGGGGGGGRGRRHIMNSMYVIMSWHCGTGCLTDFQVAKVFRQFQLHVGYEYGGI